MSSLATRLKQSRTSAGLSQEALAEIAKVSQSLIGNLESGNQKSTSKIAQIAAALGVNALWLAIGKGEPRPITSGANEPSAGYNFLTPEERAMLATYRELTREQRNEHLRRAEETQQANASIIAELAGKGRDGTNG